MSGIDRPSYFNRIPLPFSEAIAAPPGETISSDEQREKAAPLELDSVGSPEQQKPLTGELREKTTPLELNSPEQRRPLSDEKEETNSSLDPDSPEERALSCEKQERSSLEAPDGIDSRFQVKAAKSDSSHDRIKRCRINLANITSPTVFEEPKCSRNRDSVSTPPREKPVLLIPSFWTKRVISSATMGRG